MKATLDDTSFGQQDACAEWFALALHGDEEAATRLYQYCVPKMRHWLGAWMPDIAAEELAHDAMVTAFCKQDRFRPGTLFYPWVKTIAWRQAQNQRRDHMRQHERDRAYIDHQQLFGGDAENESRFAALAQSLSDLSESQRHLLHLHYWEGQTGRAIADAQGRTRSAVAVNMHRICQRLRHDIKDIEHKAEDDRFVMKQQSLDGLAL